MAARTRRVYPRLACGLQDRECSLQGEWIPSTVLVQWARARDEIVPAAVRLPGTSHVGLVPSLAEHDADSLAALVLETVTQVAG
eukprot:scaffold71822_cov100-Phaeocystis_antarctica.AAC.1